MKACGQALAFVPRSLRRHGLCSSVSLVLGYPLLPKKKESKNKNTSNNMGVPFKESLLEHQTPNGEPTQRTRGRQPSSVFSSEVVRVLAMEGLFFCISFSQNRGWRFQDLELRSSASSKPPEVPEEPGGPGDWELGNRFLAAQESASSPVGFSLRGSMTSGNMCSFPVFWDYSNWRIWGCTFSDILRKLSGRAATTEYKAHLPFCSF